MANFKAIHNLNIIKVDGNYQIDIYAEFEAFGGAIKVLVECKRYKYSVKRETVQLLFDKLRATGSHKGMIFSTSGFQSGAIKFAKEHGIALIKVLEGKLNYSTKSRSSVPLEIPDWVEIPKFQGEFTFENEINYLQIGYLDPLAKFIFTNRSTSAKIVEFLSHGCDGLMVY